MMIRILMTGLRLGGREGEVKEEEIQDEDLNASASQRIQRSLEENGLDEGDRVVRTKVK